jgi:hypothetical protein
MSRRLRQQRFFGEDPPPPEPEPDPDDVTAILILKDLGGRSGFEIPWDDEEVIDEMIVTISKIIRNRRAARG